MHDAKINKEYKDRLFCLLFGKEEYKENILSLYNALNNTAYTDVGHVEITTIDDAIYIKMKNDVSFLIDSYLSLWEQQSTFNPNMPVRGLMYYGKLYNAYIKGRSLNIYGRTLVPIPTPQYTVLYNGEDDEPSAIKLKLSDAFVHKDDSGEFQWTATMINLNKGKNDQLLSKCKVLSDYIHLINLIRTYQKELPFEDAVDKAVVECIENDVLAEFLTKHRAEVLDVCITEYDEKAFINGIHEEGRQEGAIKTLTSLVSKGLLTLEEAAAELGVSVEEFQQKMQSN